MIYSPFIEMMQTILYVSDQQKSMVFYKKMLRMEPTLHVPGMTEFLISEKCKLGLMPNSGIHKILQDHLPHPKLGTGIPRCEIYLIVNDVDNEHNNLISIGAKLISPPKLRDWGDKVCYFADLDGHVIAMAQKIKTNE